MTPAEYVEGLSRCKILTSNTCPLRTQGQVYYLSLEFKVLQKRRDKGHLQIYTATQKVLQKLICISNWSLRVHTHTHTMIHTHMGARHILHLACNPRPHGPPKQHDRSGWVLTPKLQPVRGREDTRSSPVTRNWIMASLIN